MVILEPEGRGVVDTFGDAVFLLPVFHEVLVRLLGFLDEWQEGFHAHVLDKECWR